MITFFLLLIFILAVHTAEVIILFGKLMLTKTLLISSLIATKSFNLPSNLIIRSFSIMESKRQRTDRPAITFVTGNKKK